MKQRITVEQLNELSDEQRKRLQELWKPDINDIYTSIDKNMLNQATVFTIEEIDSSGFIYDWRFGVSQSKSDCVPIISIGQMIELLLTSGKYMFDIYLQASVKEKSYVFDGWRNAEDGIEDGEGTYLCDALWEAVKKVL